VSDDFDKGLIIVRLERELEEAKADHEMSVKLLECQRDQWREVAEEMEKWIDWESLQPPVRTQLDKLKEESK
jgi:hypothetical protein